mgnify:CR=1 FL=1|tara:strand:- start:12 stop:488 length:477 start_codon:yes stop_codon:yes gene_type:complete
MLSRFVLFIIIAFSSFSQANSFSEVFGSEGASGINNPKQRFLSFTLQYMTLSGSIGFAGKQLYDSGFFSPFGFVPEAMKELSPLAYKSELFESDTNIKLVNLKTQIDALNKKKDFELMKSANRFSINNIEMRVNNNIGNSLRNSNNRNLLVNRYSGAK